MGAADRDRNRLTDEEPTTAMPTNGLYIPAKDEGPGSTASGGDESLTRLLQDGEERGARAREGESWVS